VQVIGSITALVESIRTNSLRTITVPAGNVSIAEARIIGGVDADKPARPRNNSGAGLSLC
jgi:hypothetical protein